jgi:hypothetical protein
MKAVKQADWKKWPYISTVLVVLTTDVGYAKCTGSLVRPDRVLTAGHCAIEPNSQMLSADVYFGVFGNVYYGPTASSTTAWYYQAWSVDGLAAADFSVLYLDRKITSIPVAKYIPGPTLTKGSNAVRKLTNCGYPHFSKDTFASNNFVQGFGSTAGYHTKSSPCGTTGTYLFSIPSGSGQSGGPIYDVASKKIIATTDFECSPPTGCNPDFSCTLGQSPISTKYSIDVLCSQ